jgi:hypothetical protein
MLVKVMISSSARAPLFLLPASLSRGVRPPRITISNSLISTFSGEGGSVLRGSLDPIPNLSVVRLNEKMVCISVDLVMGWFRNSASFG